MNLGCRSGAACYTTRMDDTPLQPADDDYDEAVDGPLPLPRTFEEIKASLARAEADVAAGRTVDGQEFVAEMRAKIDAFVARRADGSPRG